MQLSNPSLFVTFITIFCLGYLLFTNLDSQHSKIPYALIISLTGIIYIYATNCLSKGDCSIFSWLISILITLYILFFTFFLSNLPFNYLLDIKRRSDLCTIMTMMKDPRTENILNNLIQ
jgi:hypothetical protein